MPFSSGGEFTGGGGGGGGGGVVVGSVPGSVWLAGQWYSSMACQQAVTAQQVQNTGYAIPFIVSATHTFVAIGISVVTGVASTTARLGIYGDTGSVYPGSLIVDAGAVSTAVATNVSAAISTPLVPGLYWLVMVALGGTTSCASACLGIGSAIQRTTDIQGILGNATINGNNPGAGFSIGNLTLGALPSTFTAGGSLVVNQNAPYISLQA